MQKKSGRSFFHNLTIESLSVFDVLDFCQKQDYAGLTEYLLKGICNLAAAGARYAALTGITPHIVFDELSKVSPIPLISMVNTARDHAAAQYCAGINRWPIMSKRRSGFYRKNMETHKSAYFSFLRQNYARYFPRGKRRKHNRYDEKEMYRNV